jgi:hypothetical protein
MQFWTEQEAYDFYNAYAGVKGFSIRRSSSHSVKNSTTIKNRTFCCSRAGITLNSSCIIFLIVKVRTSRPISKGIILTKDNLAKRNWTGSKQCCFFTKMRQLDTCFFTAIFIRLRGQLLMCQQEFNPPSLSVKTCSGGSQDFVSPRCNLEINKTSLIEKTLGITHTLKLKDKQDYY